MEFFMTRALLPLHAADLSSFARSLAQQLVDAPHPPGHQALLNMLARAAGHRNLQALRATQLAPRLSRAPHDHDAALPLSPIARRALMQFDSHGRLARWPNKYSVQRLAMWVLWTRFDARRIYTEREINDILKAWNAFGDHVTLRRELVEMKLLARKSDCSEYRKLPAQPTDEVRALIRAWRLLARAG
jgi:hypothetical protein